ncbi:uncharacterized protein LOC129587989 [Paramacrobiotus metropolitanus]|uniref:uncharacterized protein LOC129587989 n=1 Tax=Paramacrobiotus metropolitanus TaxID=2943436 RepID=UPI002445FE95|nr:uncharacterized protein LOC129587989 [Paramacrobiotus metropolitanus]
MDDCAELGWSDIPLDLVWEIYSYLDAVAITTIGRVCSLWQTLRDDRPRAQHRVATLEVTETGCLIATLPQSFSVFGRDILRSCVRSILPSTVDTVVVRKAASEFCPPVNNPMDVYEYSDDMQGLMRSIASTRPQTTSDTDTVFPMTTVHHPLPLLVLSHITLAQNLFHSDQYCYSAPWVHTVRLHRVSLRARMPFDEWIIFAAEVADAVIPVADGPGLGFTRGTEPYWAWPRFVAESAGALTAEEEQRAVALLGQYDDGMVKELTRFLARSRDMFEEDGLPAGAYKPKPLKPETFLKGTPWLKRFVLAFLTG